MLYKDITIGYIFNSFLILIQVILVMYHKKWGKNPTIYTITALFWYYLSKLFLNLKIKIL